MNKASPLVERFATGGPILKYAFSGLSAEQEQLNPGPGQWSFAQLASHLVDTDLVFADRIKRVIAEPEPTLQGFDENAWIDRLVTTDTRVDEAVELFVANRRWTAGILRRCEHADFARIGLHTEKGRMTLAEVLAYVTNHLDHHLRFLYAKRATLGIALPPRYTSEALTA